MTHNTTKITKSIKLYSLAFLALMTSMLLTACSEPTTYSATNPQVESQVESQVDPQVNPDVDTELNDDTLECDKPTTRTKDGSNIQYQRC